MIFTAYNDSHEKAKASWRFGLLDAFFIFKIPD